MIPLEQAQTFVLSACPTLPVRSEPIAVAIGCVLAADVVSGEAVPPFDNSAVDGYAVRAQDTVAPPVELAVVDEVAAGSHSSRLLGNGEAIRIMTGAPIPDGADAVVMVENTERLAEGDRVRVLETVAVEAGIRRAASDVAVGDILFDAGVVVTPAIAGVLASINAREVEVIARPMVGVLCTGDELVSDGGPLAPGQIRESNLVMLDGLLRESGVDVINYGVVPDDESTLAAALRQAAAECDAIVTSGGVSMGDYDVVKAVLADIADMAWMQVAIKPAKPFAFGMLDDTPIFGLPGNPVSSLVSFEMFARPALRRMAGFARLARPSVVAVAAEPFDRRPDGRTHLDRAVATFAADGTVSVVPARAQGSHQLAATATANAIAVIPDGETLQAGEDVAVLLLDH